MQKNKVSVDIEINKLKDEFQKTFTNPNNVNQCSPSEIPNLKTKIKEFKEENENMIFNYQINATNFSQAINNLKNKTKTIQKKIF